MRLPLPLRNLPLDLLDHLCQLLLAFLSGLGIHVPPDPFAVGTSGRVFALPEVVVELVDAAGAGFAVLALVGLEAALVGGLSLLTRRDGSVGLADLTVDFGGRLKLHGVGDVGVDVQGGGRGDVADDHRQGFDVHAVLQCHGGEGMAQVMEANLLALRPLQCLLHPAADEVGRQRTVLLHRRREHPSGVHRRLVGFQHRQQGAGQYHRSDGRLGLRLRDMKLGLDDAHGLVDPQLAGYEAQVIPLQCQDLPQPHARAQLQQEEFIVPVLSGLDQEPLHLLLGQDVHLAALLRRQLAADGGVRADQPLLHRLLQS